MAIWLQRGRVVKVYSFWVKTHRQKGVVSTPPFRDHLFEKDENFNPSRTEWLVLVSLGPQTSIFTKENVCLRGPNI